MITNETKAKIRCNYYGQKMIFPEGDYVYIKNINIDNDLYSKGSIVLKHLSSITAEDAIEIVKLISKDNKFLKVENGVFEFLKQMGYALPQVVITNGRAKLYTVDQLVKEGVYTLEG